MNVKTASSLALQSPALYRQGTAFNHVFHFRRINALNNINHSANKFKLVRGISQVEKQT